jgi:flagellin
MPLNIISNYAADTAHRYLMQTQADATRTIAQLSSGSRVATASDDPASLAVGTRLLADVNAMTTAMTNASTAASILQVADGAMGTVGDLVTRMKSLAVQASSGQLSDTERLMIDTEYQQLVTELNQIALSTSFDGKRLLSFSGSTLRPDALRTDAQYMFSKEQGVESLDTSQAPAGSLFASNFDPKTNNLTIVNLTTGDSQTQTLSFRKLAASQTEHYDFATLGVSIDINKNFPKSYDSPSNNSIIQTASGGQLGLNSRIAGAPGQPVGFTQLTSADAALAASGSSLASYDWLDTLKLSNLSVRTLQNFKDMPAGFQELRLSTSYDNGLTASLYDDSTGGPGAQTNDVNPLAFNLGQHDTSKAGDAPLMPAQDATVIQFDSTQAHLANASAVDVSFDGGAAETLNLPLANSSPSVFVSAFNQAVGSTGGDFAGLVASLSGSNVQITDTKGRTVTLSEGASSISTTAKTPGLAALDVTATAAGAHGTADFKSVSDITLSIGGSDQTLALAGAAADTDDFVTQFNTAAAAAGGVWAGITATKVSASKVEFTDAAGRTLGLSSTTPPTTDASLNTSTYAGAAGAAATPSAYGLDATRLKSLASVTGYSLTVAGQTFTGTLSLTAADTPATVATKLQTALAAQAPQGANNVDVSNLTVSQSNGALVVTDPAGRTISNFALTGGQAQIFTHVQVVDTNGQVVPMSNGGYKNLAAGDSVTITVDNGQAGPNQKSFMQFSFKIANADGIPQLSLQSGGAPRPVADLFLNAYKMFGSSGQESDGSAFSFQVGATAMAQDTIAFKLPSVSALQLGLANTSVATAGAASAAIGVLDPALNTVSTMRATIGALQSRFNFVSSNLNSMRDNTDAGRSSLMDLDVASAMTKEVSQQVLLQAGIAVLAQAQQAPAYLLKLFH